MIKINIIPRGGKASNRFPITVELSESSTVEELKKLIQDSSRVSSFPFSSLCFELLTIVNDYS